jgi:2',3'-cyclic-nucleotide 2'-phosphodiesterase / 3'-nucleotidase / 5'-nucleotidase
MKKIESLRAAARGRDAVSAHRAGARSHALPAVAVALILPVLVASCAPALAPAADGSGLAPDTMSLVLLGTTDVHGRVYNHDYYTGAPTDHGLALLKPVIDSVRAANPGRTLLFDSGDLLQGNPLGLVHARQYGDERSPIIHAMNLLGYAASAIGNHEYNYGLDHLNRAIEQATFPFVAANVFRHGTAQHAHQPYALLPVATPHGDTVMVGVTGSTPPGVHVWDRENVTGILEFREIVQSVRPVVAEMRQRGADVVVVLSHGGLEGTSYDTVTTGLPPENAAAAMAMQVPGIDVIFMGHTHREVADTTINGVLLTQPGQWARSVAAATLLLERDAAGSWRAVRSHGRILRPVPTRADRAFLDSLRWPHERTVAWVNARIGTAPEALPAREGRVRDTPIIDFINEVQRRAAGAELSSTAAFQIAAGLPAGDITIAHIAALYPYDNTLKAVRISGAQLRAYLEKSAEYYAGWPAAAGGTVTNLGVPGYNFDIVSGVEYDLDISRPLGQRVTRLLHEGRPVRDADSFTMALNNYRQSGGGGYDMLAGAEVVYDSNDDVRELLIDEVRRRGTIRASDYFTQNWRLLPEAAAAAALTEQTAREAPATADLPAGAHVAPQPVPIPPRKRLRVLTLNDYHGRLEAMTPTWAGGRPVGGAAALSTYFELEREGFNGPTILLHGGDVMQGTPVSNLTLGRATIDIYNHMGWHAGALGNHEFDWGLDVLRDRIAQSDFPWLAANIHVAGSDTTPGWVRDTATIVVDGVRVGVIGLITEETGYKTMAEYVAGLDFVDGAAMIDRWVPVLRRTGADFVIVVAHEGATCDADMTSCSGPLVEWAQRARHRPDLMVGGHTHLLVRWHENGVAIIEAGLWGTHYGVVDLERVTADSVDAWIRGTPVAWADRVQPDTTVQRMVAAAVAEVGPQLVQHIADVAEPLERGEGENAMGRVIADAQRWKAGAQVAIMNAGGVRAPLQAGPATWGDLYQVHPFGNMLVVLELRGSDLRSVLEHAVRGEVADAHVSGIRVRYDPDRPPGSRVVSALLEDGSELRDDGVYTVVTNDFLASGVGDGYAPFGRSISDTPTGVTDLDALIEYMQSLPQPVRAPRDIRLQPMGGT